jgi:ribose transport system substrate-binding protein
MGTGRLAWTRVAMLLALAAIACLGIAACGGSSDSSSSSGGSTEAETGGEEAGGETGGEEAGEEGETEEASEEGGEESGGSGILAEAEKQLEEAYKGRFTEPPSKPNPAAKGKTVWYISPGQASPNAAQGYIGLKEAAAELGWTLKLYDAKLDPANFSTGIKQAVASGADGVITLALDCSQTKSALEEAREHNVFTVTMLGFDCDESDPGEEPQYSAPISLGDRYKNWVEAYEDWGRDTAAWIIANTNAEAKLLNFTNDEYLIISNTVKGLSEEMDECETCEVTDVPWTLSEVGTKVTNKVKDSFVRVPEANTLFNSLNPLVGFATGIEQAGKTESVQAIGGVGMPEDFELIEAETKGLNAIAAWPFAWWAWAASDTLNSLFDGNEVEDSGLGWQMVDKEHNMPKAGGQLEPEVDYKAIYRKRWGV